MMFRQGDVLLVAITAIAASAVMQKPQSQVVLALGEATGHAHRLEDVTDGLLTEIDGVLYLDVRHDNMRIVHEEHKPVIHAPGSYQVIRQREYSPAAIRNVAD